MAPQPCQSQRSCGQPVPLLYLPKDLVEIKRRFHHPSSSSWAHSSVGQSSRLIIGRSLVRVQLGPFLTACKWAHCFPASPSPKGYSGLVTTTLTAKRKVNIGGLDLNGIGDERELIPVSLPVLQLLQQLLREQVSVLPDCLVSGVHFLQPKTNSYISINSDKFSKFKDSNGNSAVPYLLEFETR